MPAADGVPDSYPMDKMLVAAMPDVNPSDLSNSLVEGV
jgi:hypothetical protein